MEFHVNYFESFFFVILTKIKIHTLLLLTLVKVNSGIAREAFTKKSRSRAFPRL